MKIKETEGVWDIAEAPIYFPAAGSAVRGARDVVDYCLFNLLDLGDKPDFIRLTAERSTRIFLDSGVFSIANLEAKRRGIPIYEAFTMQPEEMHGWGPFVESWKRTVSAVRELLWGYIELDLGGPETKTRIRESLEADGFRPIPVSHPLKDGWDYFEWLADRYDRICVSNLQGNPAAVKFDILRQVNERRKGRAVKWIHALGISPAPMWITMPTESCDASSPAGPLRFPSPMVETSAFSVSPIPSMAYRYDCGPERYQTMVRHLYRDADLMGKSIHAHLIATT
jgi:hypothetical protein